MDCVLGEGEPASSELLLLLAPGKGLGRRLRQRLAPPALPPPQTGTPGLPPPALAAGEGRARPPILQGRSSPGLTSNPAPTPGFTRPAHLRPDPSAGRWKGELIKHIMSQQRLPWAEARDHGLYVFI